MSPQFAHPQYLFLAALAVPALLFHWFLIGKAVAALAPFIDSRSRVPGRDRRGSFALSLRVRAACFALAWVSLTVAAAGPRWGTRLVAKRQEGSSVMFVMDISRSMTLSDAQPTRLSYAARYASLLTERMEKTPCGLVLAKGDAVLALPLTVDHRALRDLLASLSPSLLTSPGSCPGKGVLAALRAFPETGSQSRTIVLFTDGDETVPTLEDAARACRVAGTRLLIVGVGTVSGASIRIYPGSDNPETRESRLREDALSLAAEIAGGGSLYVPGSETGSALRVLDSILEGTDSRSRLVYTREPVSRYGEFLLAALALLSAGVVVGGLSWKRR